MHNKTLRIGILGLGTVGGGVVSVLSRNKEDISRRLGGAIRIVAVAVRDLDKKREHLCIHARNFSMTDDPIKVVEDENVDVVVELMGGIQPSKSCILRAIELGKPVVTANKALLAEHGSEIFALAYKHKVGVYYEAAIAGGIPIVKVLRESMSGNSVEGICGIINGTCNYILTQISKTRCDFATALENAQTKGFSEADPTFDIDGIDAAHKLCLMAAVAFGIPLCYDKIYTQGIRGLFVTDVVNAESLGYVVKHIGVARRYRDAIELRVHPALIPGNSLLAHVNGEMNAVMVRGNAAGESLYYGSGAGALATASSVVSDLADVYRNQAIPSMAVPCLAFHPDYVESKQIIAPQDMSSAFYLRFQVIDKPGVLAKISQVLASFHIGLESVVQKERATSTHPVPLVMITYPALCYNLGKAIEEIEALDCVIGAAIAIRVEKFIWE